MTQSLSLLLVVLLTGSPAAALFCGRACVQPRRAKTTASHCALHAFEQATNLTAGVNDCLALHDAVPAMTTRDAVFAPVLRRAIDASVLAATPVIGARRSHVH